MACHAGKHGVLWRIARKVKTSLDAWHCDAERISCETLIATLRSNEPEPVFLIEYAWADAYDKQTFTVQDDRLDTLNFPELIYLNDRLLDGNIRCVYLSLYEHDEHWIKHAVFFSENDAILGRALLENWNFKDPPYE